MRTFAYKLRDLAACLGWLTGAVGGSALVGLPVCLAAGLPLTLAPVLGGVLIGLISEL